MLFRSRTQGSESRVASWMISVRAPFICRERRDGSPCRRRPRHPWLRPAGLELSRSVCTPLLVQTQKGAPFEPCRSFWAHGAGPRPQESPPLVPPRPPSAHTSAGGPRISAPPPGAPARRQTEGPPRTGGRSRPLLGNLPLGHLGWPRLGTCGGWEGTGYRRPPGEQDRKSVV